MTNNTNGKRLLYFFGRECEHCERMKPAIEKLEKEEKVKLEKFETWHNEENAKLAEQYDQNLCGGVPFFFNTHSKEWVCGETSYEKLKEWALG